MITLTRRNLPNGRHILRCTTTSASYGYSLRDLQVPSDPTFLVAFRDDDRSWSLKFGRNTFPNLVTHAIGVGIGHGIVQPDVVGRAISKSNETIPILRDALDRLSNYHLGLMRIFVNDLADKRK